jgi:hypothetical protein
MTDTAMVARKDGRQPAPLIDEQLADQLLGKAHPPQGDRRSRSRRSVVLAVLSDATMTPFPSTPRAARSESSCLPPF